MTGGELQTAVIDLARTLGWKVAHFRPAQTSKGWRTPVAADGKGWPDLVLVGPGGVMFREIKGQKEPLTPEQQQWQIDLAVARADVGVWRPSDWPSIVAELSGGRARVA